MFHARSMKNWFIGLGLVLLLCITGWGCTAPSSEQKSTRRLPSVYPSPMLYDATERALQRLVSATGVQVLVHEDGIPLEYGSPVANNKPVCGITLHAYDKGHVGEPDHYRYTEAITIDQTKQPDCSSDEATVLHEVIHYLMAPHIKLNSHATSGIYGSRDDGYMLFTEDSLVFICEYLSCTAFNPES